MVVEALQIQPTDIPGGFSSLRIWINGVGMNRTFFGNVTAGQPLFLYPSEPTFDMCMRYNDNTTDFITKYSGQFDMMNFLWYRGTEGAWNDPSGKFFLLI